MKSVEYSEMWTKVAIDRIDTVARKGIFSKILPIDIKSVLEVGCGAGYNLAAIRFCSEIVKLTGIDNLEYAISEAKKRYRTLNIDFELASAQELPFDSHSFDLVLCCGFFDWVDYDNLPYIIGEVSRVTDKYILVIDYGFVGDIKPFGTIDLLVVYKGKPLYIVRDYLDRFPGFELIDYHEKLSSVFSAIPISSWLFKKEKKDEIFGNWHR